MTRATGDRGTTATELVLLAPVLVALMLFVVFCGRLAGAQHDLDAAAEASARAASLHFTPDGAMAAADDTARATLADHRLSCSALTVDTDTSQLRPGGWITVNLSCTVNLSDITAIGVPGAKTLSSHSTQVIDRYRSTPVGSDSSGAGP